MGINQIGGPKILRRNNEYISTEFNGPNNLANNRIIEKSIKVIKYLYLSLKNYSYLGF